jgi:hypothetical protein
LVFAVSTLRKSVAAFNKADPAGRAMATIQIEMGVALLIMWRTSVLTIWHNGNKSEENVRARHIPGVRDLFG